MQRSSCERLFFTTVGICARGCQARQRVAYRLCAEARALIHAAPKRQVVAADYRLEWKDVDLRTCPGDLAKVVRLVQTVRNNLFHGAKHGAEGWDDPGRTARLLELGVTVLDRIAEHAGLEADYTGCY